MKKLLSILLVAVLLASMSFAAFADVVIQDMPKSNHKIKEAVYYDKNPNPNAEGEMVNYPAVWMLYDDPDNHTNSEVFVLKEAASKEEANNSDFGYEGFRINGKWYKVVGLWTVNPESDIIDKGNGEKAVFTPLYYSEADTPQAGDKVQLALYDYDSKGISNLVDVVVPEEGGESRVTAGKTTINPKALKSKIYVGGTTTIKPNVKNGSGATSFITSDKKIAVVDKNGKVTGKGAGVAIITVVNNGEKSSVKITVIKKTNTVIASAKKLTVKHNTKKVFKNAIKVKNPKGKISFKKTSGEGLIKLNSKTGTITVNKGLNKGSYKIKVKVSDKGSKTYGSASKTITIKITVK